MAKPYSYKYDPKKPNLYEGDWFSTSIPASGDNWFNDPSVPISGLGGPIAPNTTIPLRPGVDPSVMSNIKGWDWMGKGGIVDLGAQGLGALTGGLQAYTGYKGLGLAEEQFDFEKRLAEANYANQAALANMNTQRSADIGLAIGGGAMTPEEIAAKKAKTASQLLKPTL